MKVTRLILAVVLSSIHPYANAQLIPSNLPTTLKNRCSDTEDCSISHYSSSPLMQVYQLSGSLENLTPNYYDGLSSANNYWLIQYDSKKGSVKNGFSGKAGPNPGFEQEITPIFREFNNEPVSGNVWVLAPTTLDQSWNNFAVFTKDKDISLYMSSEVAISGAGYYVDESLNPELQGNMSVDYFRCIPCGFDMDFNLIGLNYLSDFTSEINEDDKRALLLRFRDYLDNWPSEHDIETKIFVQAVPLPSAVWLFASCLFGCFFRFSKKT